MMGFSASPFSLPPTLKTSRCCSPSAIFIPSSSKSPNPRPFSNSNLKSFRRFNQRSGVQCSSSNRTPGPGSDENESKVVLDAFFLGKAFAEALNERIGSTVGEILSVVGQWQAEQQKQVQDFQDDADDVEDQQQIYEVIAHNKADEFASRKEIADLQNKEVSMKKAAAKGSKAEQKAKKKQVEDEISQLSSQLKAKHLEELASLGFNNESKERGNLNTLVMAIAGVSINSQGDSSKPSKGAKRREKRAQQEAAREQRIEEEQNNIISDRVIENEKLEKKLEPLGLTINEIKPDGHCLYRAVEDQLSFHSRSAAPYNFLELRKIAANYMREHASDFLPFFLSDNKVVDSGGSPMERFKQYCEEVESTAAWGGQLELGALMHCLKKHIVIYSGSFPDVEMGKEYKSESESSEFSPSIMLSYHMHAYGLGEHYNSVVPIMNR